MSRELVELTSKKSELTSKPSVVEVWFVVLTSLHVVPTVRPGCFVERSVVVTERLVVATEPSVVTT